jgi:hypothetical protein
MGSMPFAFSVHNFISSVGADAGFAAIIGLAVLILLYFAHARETANLREEATILAERLQQAEARVAELSRPQHVSAPVPAAEGVQVTDRRGEVMAPFAPAGLGAPALAAATRVVPLPDLAAPVPAPQPAFAAAAAPAAVATASPPVAPPPASVASPPAPSGLPGPATSAGATSAGASSAGASSAPTNGGGRSGAPVMAPPPPRGPSSGGGQLRDLPPLGPPAGGRSSRAARIVIGLISLVFVAVVVVALVILTSSSSNSGSSTRASSGTPTSNAPAPRHPVAFSPASVTVAVLNGTATNQLAHKVAAKLARGGYKDGTIATAPNQTEATTIVAYLPGKKNRTDALHVATALALKPAAVHPIDQGTMQVACPPPGACTANVVVTVGADLSTLS